MKKIFAVLGALSLVGGVPVVAHAAPEPVASTMNVGWGLVTDNVGWGGVTIPAGSTIVADTSLNSVGIVITTPSGQVIVDNVGWGQFAALSLHVAWNVG